MAKLTASDKSSYDYFGYSVAIDGDTLVVGAYNDGNPGYYNAGPGAAYVFHTTDGGATYGQVAKLTAADAAAYDYFGGSVAIEGATIVVGAHKYYGAGSGAVWPGGSRSQRSRSAHPAQPPSMSTGSPGIAYEV